MPYLALCRDLVAVLVFCGMLPVNAFATDPDFSLYTELGGRGSPSAIGGDIGIQWFRSDTIATQAGLSFIASDSIKDLFTGAHFGVRLDAPRRSSPFVGAGVFAGYAEKYIDASRDGIDNDRNGITDEIGEEERVIDRFLASVYPFAGVKWLVAKGTMLTFTSKYHVTSAGRQNDFWMYELGILFALL